MKIKDMIFACDGEIKIDEETTLKNPRFELMGCRCDLKSNEAFLLVEFYEEGGIYRHGREYAFTASENGVTANDFINLISSHEVLSKFKLQ